MSKARTQPDNRTARPSIPPPTSAATLQQARQEADRIKSHRERHEKVEVEGVLDMQFTEHARIAVKQANFYNRIFSSAIGLWIMAVLTAAVSFIPRVYISFSESAWWVIAGCIMYGIMVLHKAIIRYDVS